MAHDLGLSVVAEGVETEEDAVRLRQLHCEYAQSYMYSQPLTPEMARRRLQDKQIGLKRAG